MVLKAEHRLISSINAPSIHPCHDDPARTRGSDTMVKTDLSVKGVQQLLLPLTEEKVALQLMDLLLELCLLLAHH